MYRQIALIATTALILAGCGAAPTGLSTGLATQNGAVDALRRTSPKQSASEFTNLIVNSVSMLRDGGTVILKGYINRSTYVTLRFDNKLTSKTKGQIFMAITTFGGGEGTEREVTADEAGALADGVRANMKRADMDAKLLDRVAKALEVASKAERKGAFADLEIVSLDAQPVRCPCFTLTAKAGDTTVTVDFEGFTDPLTVTRVEVNGREADEAQRKALAPALEKAAGNMKDKQLSARIKQVAKSL